MKGMNEANGMNRLAKELLAMALCFSILLGSSGCFFHRKTRLPGDGKTEIIENQLNDLLEAIEDEDVDAIIDMFAQEALDQIDDMDEFEEDIEELIETFPGWEGDYDKMKVGEYKVYNQKRDEYFYYNPDIRFTVEEEEFELHLVMVYAADKKERVGLYVILLCDEDVSDYQTPGYYCKAGESTEPGVYCWDCEVR